MRRYALSAVLLVFVLSSLAYTLVVPRRQPLVETALWGGLVITSFLGWGALLRRSLFPRAKADLGLLAAWGASIVCFVGAVLAAVSLLRRPTLIGLVLAGVVLATHALVREVPGTRALSVLARFARREPVFAFVCLLAAGFVGLHYLGAVANWHTDPREDDPAYLGLVKKLLDTGSFPEPFSVHRATALGAQTVFLALVAPRAAIAQSHTFDRGICLVLIVLLVAGWATSRKPPLLFRVGAVAFLLIVPVVAQSTSSYFSGVVFFLALVRTLAFLQRRSDPSWARAAPIALLATTTCALRDTYLFAAPAIVFASYAFLVRRARALWREAAVVAALFAVLLAPWLWMHWRGAGIVNAALPLQSSGATWASGLLGVVTIALDELPIRTLPVLVVVLALLRDEGPRRPIWSAAAGLAVCFVAVAFSHEPFLAPHVFGLMMAIALVAILESGVQVRRRPIALGRTTIAAAIGLSCVLVELLETRQTLTKGYKRSLEDIDALVLSEPSSRTSRAGDVLYGRLQAAVPSGVRLAVMLDDAAYLDYARNPILNLDLPGYASIPPGQPFFQGSAKLADYLRAISVRWVAFVRPDRSRYQYRREHWIGEMSDEREPFRAFAPYIIDTVDALTDLATKHRIAFEEHGVVVLDLDAPP